MRSKITLALALALALIGSAARADDPAGTFSVDAEQSSLSFFMVHKLHKFQGTSKKLEGRARVLPTGEAQVAVRARVETFDSGNVNRDEHMKETVEAARFPTVELKALLDGLTVPATFPAAVAKRAHAQVTFHGVSKEMEIPVAITFESATRVSAASDFTLSLDAFGVARPSLMFVKVDDEMKVHANLVFKK